MLDLRKQKQSFFNSFCLPVVGPCSRMRKRERENLCGICDHYHKDEEGELCGIYGHRIRSDLRNLSFKLVPLHRKSCRSFCILVAMLTPLGQSFLNTFWSENLAGVSTGGGGGGCWAMAGETAGGLYGWERERERERDGWVGLEVVAAGGCKWWR
ncbi:putative protein-tyrosine-phosphatase [Helianthus debilis subsp. tardiflorus]